MIDIVLAIITRLKANTTLCSSSHVGASPNQRIYRSTLAKNPTFPCITVHRVSNIRANESSTGKYATSRIQCTAWAPSDLEADTIAELIADDLNMMGNTYLSPGVHVVSIQDGGATPDVNPVVKAFMYHRDFVVEYLYT